MNYHNRLITEHFFYNSNKCTPKSTQILVKTVLLNWEQKFLKSNFALQITTARDKKKLFFNVFQGPTGNETVTVEGGGVNATIITANIGATNGIIHITDRVLGVPYTTVLDKLRTDPTLK